MPDISEVRNGFFDLFHVFFVTGRQNTKCAKPEFLFVFFLLSFVDGFATTWYKRA